MTDDDQGRQLGRQLRHEAEDVPTGDPWRTIAVVRRSATHRRQLLIGLAASIVVVVLVLPAVALGQGRLFGPPAGVAGSGLGAGASTSAPASPRPPRRSSCVGTVQMVEPSTGTRWLLRSDQVTNVLIGVGETLAIGASGPCAATVSGDASSTVLGRDQSRTRFTALRTGRTRLLVVHPMCAALPDRPDCSGGVALDGRASVQVGIPVSLATHCGVDELRVGNRYYERVGGPLGTPRGWRAVQNGYAIPSSGGTVVFRDRQGHDERFRVRPGATTWKQLCM